MRIKNDKYYTEKKLTDVLLDRFSFAGNILEPCAGDRAITKELLLHLRGAGSVRASDLTDGGPGGEWRYLHEDKTVDATTEEFWSNYSGEDDFLSVDWTITNPPFNVAPLIIPRAWTASKKGIAMLLRLTYLEPCANRAEWLSEAADHMTAIIPVNPRPKFDPSKKGTDSATVAWFVWEKEHSWEKLGIRCPFIFASGWDK